MAFYCSRVDDEGNEIERRLTARSSKSTVSSGASRLLTASSRSSDVGYGNIRHINPAAFIETTDFSDSSLNDDESHCESEAMSKSNIVPPLDIESDEGTNTRCDYTFSYRKHCETSIVDPQVAYNTWLSAKRKVKSDEAIRRKNEEEAKRQAEEERKLKAKEEYIKWLKKKEASKPNQTNKQEPSSKNTPKSHAKSKSNTSIRSSNSQKSFNEDEALARLEEWDKKKRLQEEKKRLLKQREEERKRRLEEERQRLAAEAWVKWKSTAAQKPKPVPLNQGFFSLRGTISNIYVNPNEWQT